MSGSQTGVSTLTLVELRPPVTLDGAVPLRTSGPHPALYAWLGYAIAHAKNEGNR